MAEPLYSRSNVNGRVTPLIVRSPVTRNVVSSTGSTLVDSKMISGYSSMAKKSLVRRWASRSALRVSMLATLIVTVALDFDGSVASR